MFVSSKTQDAMMTRTVSETISPRFSAMLLKPTQYVVVHASLVVKVLANTSNIRDFHVEDARRPRLLRKSPKENDERQKPGQVDSSQI